MRILLLSLLMIFALPVSAETVRVKLLRLPLPLKFEGSDLSIKGIPSDSFKKVSLPRYQSWEVDQQTVGSKKVWIVQKGDQIWRLNDLYIEVKNDGQKIKLLGYSFPSPLLLSTKNHGHTVDIIAPLDFETYIENVLLSEMPASWPLEALKSQAVATRSYSLFQMETRKTEPYQLEANVLDQAFSFHEETPLRARIRKALNETGNKVLIQNKKVAKAYFHADCGGQTEEASEVWGKSPHPSTGTTTDAHCPYSPSGQWTYDISLEDLKKKMQKGGKSIGDISDIDISGTTPSGRVRDVIVKTDKKNIFLSANDLRQFVGYEKLRSTFFEITKKKAGLRFSGKGFGHGSGLCQWGAKYLASHGSSYVEILKHYYPRAQVSELKTLMPPHVVDPHVANR